MRTIISFCVFLVVCNWSYAQIVNIPDDNFKNVLLNTNCVDSDGNGSYDTDADLNNDGEIQVSEAQSFFRMNVNNQSISSLVGIEAFTNLEFLECNNNSLTSLDVSLLG